VKWVRVRDERCLRGLRIEYRHRGTVCRACLFSALEEGGPLIPARDILGTRVVDYRARPFAFEVQVGLEVGVVALTHRVSASPAAREANQALVEAALGRGLVCGTSGPCSASAHGLEVAR